MSRRPFRGLASAAVLSTTVVAFVASGTTEATTTTTARGRRPNGSVLPLPLLLRPSSPTTTTTTTTPSSASFLPSVCFVAPPSGDDVVRDLRHRRRRRLGGAIVASVRPDDGSDPDPGTTRRGEGGGGGGGGIYRPFAEYARAALERTDLFFRPGDSDDVAVPPGLEFNSSPAGRGCPVAGSTVTIEVVGRNGRGERDGAVRCGRYALLETVGPDGRSVERDAIHVLNFVLFPSESWSSNGNDGGGGVGLPVLGADLVTLPGGKHLVALDFQPTARPPRPSKTEEEEEEAGGGRDGSTTRPPLLPTQYASFEAKLKALHERHLSGGSMPWGGDVPPAARRFFGPYAIWTRLGPGSPAGRRGGGGGSSGGAEDDGDGDAEAKAKAALDVVRNDVFDAYKDYVDLYLNLMCQVQKDLRRGGTASTTTMESSAAKGDNDDDDDDAIAAGQRDYLSYRRENDPARPMLRRLYGEEWTERLIDEVLFKMI